MYNCVCSTVLGYSVVVLIGFSTGGVTVYEERTPVGMAPGVAPVAYMGTYNDVRGRV